MLIKCFSKALLGFSSSPKRISLLQSQMLALLSAMLGYNCFLQQLGSIIITTTITYNHNSDKVNSEDDKHCLLSYVNCQYCLIGAHSKPVLASQRAGKASQDEIEDKYNNFLSVYPCSKP